MVRDLKMEKPDGSSSTGAPGETEPPHSTVMITAYIGLCHIHTDWRGEERDFEAVAQADCDGHNEQCETRSARVIAVPRPLDPV
jgi:hypothetical protein